MQLSQLLTAEERAVRDVGERIGYGRTMQLCEQLWRQKLEPKGIAGGEFSVGPAVAMLVPCPHPNNGRGGECDWCCGSGRITKRVLQAMEAAR